MSRMLFYDWAEGFGTPWKQIILFYSVKSEHQQRWDSHSSTYLNNYQTPEETK